MDIVIETIREKVAVQPIACVECKANHIELTDHVREQAERYAREIGLKYYFITNGIELFGYVYDCEKDIFNQMQKMPSYNDLYGLNYSISKEGNAVKRTPYSVLEKIEHEHYLHFLGEDTSSELCCDIVNLGECLLDTTTRLSSKRYEYFELVDDIGVRTLSYGDASGGNFGTGKYRTVVIKDNGGNNQLISIGVMPNAKTFKDPVYKTRRGNSVLVVAIDDYKKSHTSLQLNMSDFLRQGDEYTEIVHNGGIRTGRNGQGRISELKKVASKKIPHLIKGNEFYLGRFCNNELVYIDNSDIEELIVNLITYTLVREEYRG